MNKIIFFILMCTAGILFVFCIFFYYLTKEIRSEFNLSNTKQNQIILMMAGGCEPVDLTYIKKIRKNKELKEN
jgi:hypothetical protein